MITKDNIREILTSDTFGFHENKKVFKRSYGDGDDKFELSYNYVTGNFYYPEGVLADRKTTVDDHQKESYVTFLCIAQLFDIGYKPNHIRLESKNYQGNDLGWIDILVSDNHGVEYLIIECKTADVASKSDEFRKHWEKTRRNGDQLFRYFNTYRRAKYLCLFAADYPEYKKNGHKEHQFENIYNIISLVDNKDYLLTDPSLHSFEEMRSKQGGSEDFFKVWKNTYKRDFNTRGLIEKGIEPFKIGRKKYNIHDLKVINEYSLGKKYNEFALILRKYTVSSHENAFDKLVNLFIAKIIDEKQNPNELKVLWKGAAYDDYFSLQDRLNVLYRYGMHEFFNDDVAYVENKQIDEAFKFLSSKADVAKDTIKGYFRKLKYFNNNPFAFLDVHNQDLFFKNAEILRDVIFMLQDIYLTSNDNKQLLGNLFEGYLNKGVHQSEGQFFSPIPMVRFLVSSLPLKSILSKGIIPYVLDYACGAGHFLTEYAQEIQLILKQMNPGLEDQMLRNVFLSYFRNIIGIEKDYRLSKVSQVAAYMYGMDGIKIYFSDALNDINDIDRHSFHILITNPPYAVSGFLETLPEEQRENYQLTQYVSNIEKNKAIETFFVERASQMLAAGGVAAIILPASVLTKGGIFMHMREIVLKDFDIVAICNFGPSTFGQTSTSTVTLFLRRKPIEPDTATQIKNRVDAWFEGNMDDDPFYNDTNVLDAYIRHMGYTREDYLSMLKGQLTDTFMATDMVKQYAEALNIPKTKDNPVSTSWNPEAKAIRDKGQAAYRIDPTPAKRLNALLRFVRAIEREKLYYFMLASTDPQPVVIVQSPLGSKGEPDKEKEKKFLGYEWSNRKGNEGIHYLNTGKLKEDSGSGEDDDDDTISQILSIDGIQTPLFNPQNLFDENKINTLIRNNFLGKELVIPEDLEDFVKISSLVNLMDFSNVGFIKEFSSKLRSQKLIESKYNQERLSDICKDIFAGGDKPALISPTKSDATSVPIFSNGVKDNGLYGYTDKARVTEPCVTISARGTLGFCTLHKEPIFPIIRLIVAIPNEKVSVDYLCEILKHVDYINEGASTPQLSVPKFKNYKVPVPPLDIQKKIVEESVAIDKEGENTRESLTKLKYDLNSLFSNAQKTATHTVRLNNSSLFDVMIGRRVLKSEIETDGIYEVYSANVFTPFGKTNNSVLKTFDTPSVIWGIDGDWMVNYLPQNVLFNPTDHCGVIRVIDEQQVNPRYLAYALENAGKAEGFSRTKRASTERIKALTIELPSIEIQNETAKRVIELDDEIKQLQATLSTFYSRKLSILDKYLK